jgi:hypothetical protein
MYQYVLDVEGGGLATGGPIAGEFSRGGLRGKEYTVDENGNDFHYYIADYLEANDWDVDCSPYYVDLVKQKPREIDIIAEKKWPVEERLGRNRAFLVIRLFIECKWVPSSSSVYLNFLKKNERLAIELATDNDVFQNDANTLHRYLINTVPPKTHHYMQVDEVARNWACKGSNKDFFYDAWEQALNAFLYFKHYAPNRDLGSPVAENTYVVDYQVVIVNSFEKFFKRDWTTKTSWSVKDNLILSIDYSYPIFYSNEKRPHIRKDFFIDVTCSTTLKAFLDNLEGNDIAMMREQIQYFLLR